VWCYLGWLMGLEPKRPGNVGGLMGRLYEGNEPLCRPVVPRIYPWIYPTAARPNWRVRGAHQAVHSSVWALRSVITSDGRNQITAQAKALKQRAVANVPKSRLEVGDQVIGLIWSLSSI
jgi:hypothetical protein